MSRGDKYPTLHWLGLGPALDEMEEVCAFGRQGKFGENKPDPRYGHHLDHMADHMAVVRSMGVDSVDNVTGKREFAHAITRGLMALAVSSRTPVVEVVSVPQRIPVVIESPFAGEVALNRAYLQACIRDCLRRGETPYASHQQLTWALDDNNPEERELGISAGLDMRDFIRAHGGKSVYYVDLGWSSGMGRARGDAVDVEERVILGADEWERIIEDAASLYSDEYGYSRALPRYKQALIDRFRDRLEAA
jgi:hypothetical protein